MLTIWDVTSSISNPRLIRPYIYIYQKSLKKMMLYVPKKCGLNRSRWILANKRTLNPLHPFRNGYCSLMRPSNQWIGMEMRWSPAESAGGGSPGGGGGGGSGRAESIRSPSVRLWPPERRGRGGACVGPSVSHTAAHPRAKVSPTRPKNGPRLSPHHNPMNNNPSFLITQYNADARNTHTLTPMNTHTQPLPIWAPTDLEILEVTNGASSSTGTRLPLNA
jgi:hypothetical protein